MSRPLRPALVVFLVAAGLLTVVGVSNALKPKPIVPWRADFEAARDEAARTGKPVFAYFGAAWCGPCQTLKSTTWADRGVEEALRAFVPVQVDVDARRDLARRYVPTPMNLDGGIPAFRVIGPDGQITKEATGALPPGAFLEWLRG